MLVFDPAELWPPGHPQQARLVSGTSSHWQTGSVPATLKVGDGTGCGAAQVLHFQREIQVLSQAPWD